MKSKGKKKKTKYTYTHTYTNIHKVKEKIRKVEEKPLKYKCIHFTHLQTYNIHRDIKSKRMKT